MNTIEDLISTEVMGGWPVYKMNLREILLALGLKDDGTYLKIQTNDPILNIYPKRLTDDGMAYGVDSQWITEIDVSLPNKFIHVWTETELPKEELEKIKTDMIETEKIIKAKILEAKKILDENSR